MTETEKPKKKNGGARKGGGRPLNTVGKRTKFLRSISDAAIKKGVTPLEVMLSNMRYFWGRAKTTYAEFDAAATRLGVERDADGNVSEAAVAGSDELFNLLDRHCLMRAKAQLMAVEAAPFTVPKLAAIAFKGHVDHDVKKIVDGMTPEEAAAAYQETLRQSDDQVSLLPPGVIDAVAEEVDQ